CQAIHLQLKANSRKRKVNTTFGLSGRSNLRFHKELLQMQLLRTCTYCRYIERGGRINLRFHKELLQLLLLI
ncbi:hypothetical protein MKW98_022355, partial [Papaver atlanticum]